MPQPLVKKAGASGPFEVLFLLIDGFSMMALSSAIEPLRAANRISGSECYSWSLASIRSDTVEASNGIPIPTRFNLDNAPRADLTVVVASLYDAKDITSQFFVWLRKLRVKGCMLGAISNGSLLLARAGVLSNREVTVHWESTRELADTYPDLKVCSDIYCWDRGIVTAAGGAAAMDMMLAIISELDGEDLAEEVAEQFLHGPIRPGTHLQRGDLRWRFRVSDKRLLVAITTMKEHIERPEKISVIAKRSGISERQLERLFLAEIGKLPSNFYMEMRLRTARGMLIGSTEPLEIVSELCGFSSLGHFSRAFKSQYGESPSVTRRHRSFKDGGFMQENGDKPQRPV